MAAHITLEPQETPKKVAFAHAYLSIGNGTEAYALVYQPEGISRQHIGIMAHRLLKDPIVRATIADLKADAVERMMITVDDLIGELEHAREAAMDAVPVQSSAAVSATMAKAKLLGLDVNKVQVTGPNGGPLQSAAVVFATNDPLEAAKIYGDLVGR